MAKRAFDVLVSMMAIVILSPLFLTICLGILADSGPPILFRQQRVGRHGRVFRIHKFRTMVVDASALGPPLTRDRDQRVTRFGAILRRYKLDELPQFIDVLFGQMSIVGPRPELPRFVAMYPDAARSIILSVRPGITDLAAIEFRDESALLGGTADPAQVYVEQILPLKVSRYVDYVKRRTLLLDVRIMLSTMFSIWGWHGRGD